MGLFGSVNMTGYSEGKHAAGSPGPTIGSDR